MFYGYDEATAETEACSGKRMPKDPYRNHTGNYGVPLRLSGPPDLGEESAGKGKDLYKGRKGKCRVLELEVNR